MRKTTASVINLGCRVNRVESDKIAAGLMSHGFELVDEEEARLIVINTCAVTGEAEAKTRKAVRKAAGRPLEPIVIVTGCVVNLNPGELTSISDRVIAEPSKADVVSRALHAIGDVADLSEGRHLDDGESSTMLSVSSGEAHVDEDPHAISDLLGRSRYGIKIQDGCNHRCTYCIVWKARGPERSVPLDSVIRDVRSAELAGVPEVVLTGVNLGAYRYELADGTVVGIARLLQEILDQTAIPQVRLSSIEPMDVDLDLVRVMSCNQDRVAPFLHLPIQSGCTQTLRRMGRPYSAEKLLANVEAIRDILPSVSISCDLIVGFPGETDEEFDRTLEACRKIGFSRMHVFRYSKRPGTPAATAPNQVDPKVMAARSARVRRLAEQMARQDAASRIGSVENAVFEYGDKGTLGSFHKVIIEDAPAGMRGAIAPVRIESLDDDGYLHARLVDHQS